MQKTKNIPYGIADFVTLRQQNGYFVDKTRFIPELEKLNYVIFLRPRRFGKSLWLSILQSYYDIKSSEQFDELFAGTWIHENPTENRNSYLTLHFDLSAVTANSQSVQSSLDEYCQGQIQFFLMNYEKLIPQKISDII